MRSTFILGSRRSGSGLLATALEQAGLRLAPGETHVDSAHPFGVKLSPALVSINDELLLPRTDALEHYAFDQPWLAAPHGCSESAMPKGLHSRAKQLIDGASFCLHEPRLVFALPAWIDLAPDAARVCVYRHPAIAVERMVEAYGVDRDAALGHWLSTYREALAQSELGDWLFIDFDDLLTESGRGRVARFLGLVVDGEAFDDAMSDGAPSLDNVPDEARRIFEELVLRSGKQPEDAPRTRPALDAVAIIGDREREHVEALVEDVSAQRSVVARIVLVDATRTGDLNVFETETVRVVRDRSFSPGHAFQSALSLCDAPYVALPRGECRLLPTYFARAARALEEGAEVVTCDYYLSESDGRFVDRSSPQAMGDAPGFGWEGGLVLRRELLDTASPTAFASVQHRLWINAKNSGRSAHLLQPGFHLSKADYLAGFAGSRDAAASASFEARTTERLTLSVAVSVTDGNSETDLRTTLESLSRQHVPAGTFEVLVASDSNAVSVAQLRSERFSFPFRFLVRSGCASGGPVSLYDMALELAQGERVLFLQAGVCAAPDLVTRHQAGLPAAPPLHATVGAAPVPDSAQDDPLSRHLRNRAQAPASSKALFGFSNTSAPLDALLAVGGFGPECADQADLQLGRRLEEAGCPVLFDPHARVATPGAPNLGELREASRRLGAADTEQEALNPVSHAPLSRDRKIVLEEALEELTRIDVAAFEGMEGDFTELAQRMHRHAGEFFNELESIWRAEGRAAQACEGSPRKEQAGGRGRSSLREAFQNRPRSIVPCNETDVELSVIIPTHDRPAELRNLLHRLFGQDLDPRRYEVLVVDDGSSTPATDLGIQAPHLTFLRQEGGGPGMARNRAARRARGRFLCFLNDDAVPATDLLRLHLERQLATETPEALLGTFTLLPEHQQHSIGRYIETTNSLFAQPTMKPGVRYHGLSFCSGNISLPKAAFDEVGGFDEELPYAGGEDTELGLRLEEELGIRVRFDPTLRSEHDHAIDAASILGRKRVLGWVLYHLQKKHGDRGLLPLPTWPPEPVQWEALEENASSKRADALRLEREVLEICRAESRENTGPLSLPKILPVMRELETFALVRGALDAHRGDDPARRSGAATAAPEPRVCA